MVVEEEEEEGGEEKEEGIEILLKIDNKFENNYLFVLIEIITSYQSLLSQDNFYKFFFKNC